MKALDRVKGFRLVWVFPDRNYVKALISCRGSHDDNDMMVTETMKMSYDKDSCENSNGDLCMVDCDDN